MDLRGGVGWNDQNAQYIPLTSKTTLPCNIYQGNLSETPYLQKRLELEQFFLVHGIKLNHRCIKIVGLHPL